MYTTAVSRMLIVGDDVTSQRAVITQLRALCGEKSGAGAGADADVAQPLALVTKYYTASVDVHTHEVRGNEPAPALVYEPQEYEAVLCVLDTAREESFLHVSGFLTQLASEPIDVRLVIGHTAHAVEKTSAVAQRLERMQAWCVENEFEFVEVIDSDGAAAGSSSSSSNQLLDANEKQGIDRVLEALHCNMWASMVARSAPRDASDSGLRELANVSIALATPDEPTKTPVNAPNSNQGATRVGADEDQDDERLQTLLRALEITEAADDTSASANGASSTATTASKPGAKSNQLKDAAADDADDADDDDIDMAEFSALISEVRNVRDGGQTLSDEQRRQRAAEVAMKLWSFLGADDESDDDDDAGNDGQSRC